MKTREERWRAIDAAVAAVRESLFFTITAADWRRSITWARSAEGRRTPVAEQIRATLGGGPSKGASC